jgi:hypothetical protein
MRALSAGSTYAGVFLGLLAPLSACLQVIGPADAGPPACCSLDCVEVNLGCGVFPEGTPDSTCVALAGVGSNLDAGSAIAEYVAEACGAAGQGDKVGCVSAKFPGATCASIKRDAGNAALQASIQASCPGGFISGSCDSACLVCRQQCGQTANDCNAGCLDAQGYYGCLGCNASCNRQQAVCEAACISG